MAAAAAGMTAAAASVAAAAVFFAMIVMMIAVEIGIDSQCSVDKGCGNFIHIAGCAADQLNPGFRQRHLRPKSLLLKLSGNVLIVVVQTDLADGFDFV